jgi:hypothetical protein
MARLGELVGGNINRPIFTSDEQRAEVDRLLDQLDEARPSPRSGPRQSYRVLDHDHSEPREPNEETPRRRSRIPMIDRNAPLQTLRDCVADVAESLGWPCVNAMGRSFQGAGGYGPLLRSESRPDLLAALRQLEEIETRVIGREDQDREERAREAIREEPDPMFDQVLDIIAEEQARAERAASVEGRIDRLEQTIRELTERLAR